ncbi:uncharacterized protein TRAVEDRAFT_37032 [Trametes versicolor FP-101664 SS1]|uniref:uncharacterized protein n=1 Tax=Trametes versicolor (strain FP-101664) TaxID=717944 RepID=UPI0004624260|nr:uncharacterized protein TRAVEDRAFT_37032 [Trametes versicolor FP-101664 SS1]EIW59753.1 hypothetical protein TRAVEDRAFT_37032 [Trametes versicolor FP-101664 SS1]
MDKGRGTEPERLTTVSFYLHSIAYTGSMAGCTLPVDFHSLAASIRSSPNSPHTNEPSLSTAFES